MCHVPKMGGISMAKQKKSRYWGFIMYPDSRPEDWRDKLQSTGLPIAISPIHDKDENPDEVEKKHHWHVLLCFDGPTTKNCVQDIADSVNASRVLPVNSVRGMYRYHIHLDNPEKYPYWQYPVEYPRTLLNGFDIEEYSNMTSSEESMMIQLILGYVRSEIIYEYSDLLDFLEKEDIQAYNYAVHHTLLFNTYCTSKRNKLKQTQGKSVLNDLKESNEKKEKCGKSVEK